MAQALAGYSATMRVENVFSLIFVSIALKQNIKRCCNFFWLYEGVRAVEQQKIEIIGLQPF